jgi:hypothetical protein
VCCRRTHLCITSIVVFACAVVPVAAACGAGSAAPATSPLGAGSSAAASPSPGESSTPLGGAEAAAVRALTRAYWAAYNAHDADAALALLSPAYRASAEDDIRSEIGRLKTFGVRLGVEEQAPPHATGPGRARLSVTVKTPIDTRTVVMQFSDDDDSWLITSAEEAQ